MRFRNTTALMTMGAAALVFFGPVAQATSNATPSTSPPGYHLVENGPFTAPPNVQTHGFVNCPGQTQPSGGGVDDKSGSFAGAINGSYPSGSQWDVDVNNPTSTGSSFKVFAVCLAKSAKYAVMAATGVAVNGKQTSLTATCAAGTKVTGGGGFTSSTSTAVSFNSSFPKGNGWRVDMNNTSGANTNVAAYAVCRPKPKGYVVRNTGAVTNGAGAKTTVSQSCPSASDDAVAIGGGADSSSTRTSVNLNSSFANGSGGWTASEQNFSASSATVTGYAICAGT